MKFAQCLVEESLYYLRLIHKELITNLPDYLASKLSKHLKIHDNYSTRKHFQLDIIPHP